MYEWFKSLTGAWGPPLLAWYLANSWVNIPIIVYGILVMLAWRNYDQVEQRLVADLIAGAQRKRGKNKLPEQPSLTWEEAVADLGYPFIARRGQLLIRRLTPQAAQDLIDLRAVATRAQTKLDRFHE